MGVDRPSGRVVPVIVDDVQRRPIDDTTWELSARVRDSTAFPSDRLWFRVAGAPEPPGPIDGSPFVPALVLAAMVARDVLEIDAPVSPLLLENVPEIQRFYRAWYQGRIEETKVIASAAAPMRAPGEASTACCFSGGVDSWYTLLEWSRTRPLDTCITVPSLYNRLDETARARQVAALGRQAAARSLHHVVIDTNLVAFVSRVIHQHRVFGGLLAAVGLTSGSGRLLIASGNTPNSLALWGYHPMLDPLWSTERTEIVHRGHDAARIEKLALLADRDVDWSDIQVCLRQIPNCGRCEKCLRTMAGLHLVGVDPLAAFGRRLRPSAVAAARLPHKIRYYWDEIETALRRRTNLFDRRLHVAVRTMMLRDDLRQLRRGARRLGASAARAVHLR